MDLNIWKPFSYQFCSIVCIFLSIRAIQYKKLCLVFRKSACPFGQVKTKMYLPESPFFKISLNGASVLLSTYVGAWELTFPFVYGDQADMVDIDGTTWFSYL